MPRATKSRRANNTTAVTTTEEVPNMSTATVEAETVRDDLPFVVDITPAEEGFRPDRSPAGRKRIPSPFETILPGLKGAGWQNQPHDGNVIAENEEEIDKALAAGEEPPTEKYNTTSSVRESNARVILRELSKAVKHLNTPDGGKLNLGLDVNVTSELVQFNVRDKQNRKARTPQGEESVDGEQDESNGDE